MRLTNADVLLWAQFYLRLIAVNSWNGFTAWARVTFVGLAAQGAGAVDLTGISWKEALWVLLGTIAMKISEALFRHPLPEPSAPLAQPDPAFRPHSLQ